MFGNKSWDDVRADVTRRVRRKWCYSQQADVDDAVSDAVLRLVEYWLDLDTTREAILSEPHRAYGFAVWYGTRFAMNRLKEVAAEQNGVDWLDAPTRRHRKTGDVTSTRTLGDHIPSNVDVEDEALSDDPDVLLSEFLDVALADRHKRWTEPIMRGETLTEQASREGITPPSVFQGRQRACNTLRPQALNIGLAG